MSNIFAGGPTVKETFPDSNESPNYNLVNPEGNTLEADGAGMYGGLPDNDAISSAISQEREDNDENFDIDSFLNDEKTQPNNDERSNSKNDEKPHPALNNKNPHPNPLPEEEGIGNGIENKIHENIRNIPEFSIIEGLESKGHIKKEDKNELIEKLKESNNEETINVILDFINENVNNAELKSKIQKTIEGKKEINENNFEESEFFKSIKEISFEIDESIGSLEIMLAENYIEINGEKQIEGNENIEKNSKIEAIKRSINITLDKIINKNSEEFKNNNAILISEIKDKTDINSKYESLKKLHKEDLIDDTKKGGTKAKIEIKRRKEQLEQKYKKVKEGLNKQIEENKISKEEAQEKLIELQHKIIIEWSDIGNFEKEIGNIEGMMGGGEIDKSSENNE